MKKTGALSILLALMIVIAMFPVTGAQAASADLEMSEGRTIRPEESTYTEMKIIPSGFYITEVSATIVTSDAQALEITGVSTGTISDQGHYEWRSDSGTSSLTVRIDARPLTDFTGNTKTISVAGVLIKGFYVTEETTGDGEEAVTTEKRHEVTASATPGSTTVYMASDDCSLSDLKIDGVTLSDFSSAVTTYSLPETEDGYLNVSATCTDPRSKVTGTGSIDLDFGGNRINVVVTSEYGSTRTYTVSVRRKDNRSADYSLESLTVDAGKIEFEKNRYSFNTAVDHDVESVTISAKPTDPNAVIVSGTGKFPLEDGINSFPIIVRAENEVEKTYTVYVIRRGEDGKTQELSDNNMLSSLSLVLYDFAGKDTTLDIGFDPGTMDYTVFLPPVYDHAEVKADPADPTSVVEIWGGDMLIAGKNDIHITSVSQNADTRDYSIRIVVFDGTIHTNPRLTDTDINSAASDTVTIDVTEDGEKIIPFDTITNVTLADKKLRIDCYDRGEMIVRWVFPTGADAIAKDFDCSVTFADTTGNDRYSSKTEDVTGKHVSFAYDGPLPEDAQISIYVGDVFENDALTYLYYFNKESSRLECIAEELPVADGYIYPKLEHCSQYFVSSEKIGSLDLKTAAIIGGGVLLLALIILLALRITRKKKEEYHDENEYEMYDYYDAYEALQDQENDDFASAVEDEDPLETIFGEPCVSAEEPEEETDPELLGFLDSLDELFGEKH